MPDAAAPPAVESVNPLRVLGWACFLGVSWTWCIGMFLPALLIRDFGWWGYAAFAIPNVLGAAAMGWVLTSPEASYSFIRRHRDAVRLFTFVTVAFHAFFLAWVFNGLAYIAQQPGSAGFSMLAIGFAWWFLSGWLAQTGRQLILTAGVWVLSAGLLVATFVKPHAFTPGAQLYAIDALPAGMLWLAPVCVLGFVLCPYLDATFHRARVEVPGRLAGGLAFTIGFGVFFLAMIVLTTRYAGSVAASVDLNEATAPNSAGRAIGFWLFCHLVLQSITTIQLHLRETLAPGGLAASTFDDAHARKPRLFDTLTGANAVFVVCLVSGSLAFLARGHSLPGMLGREVVYRGFMSAYGLLFPAILLVALISGRSGRASWIAALAIVVVAAPCYAAGFIWQHHVWLGIGLAVVIVGSLATIALRRHGPFTEPDPQVTQDPGQGG